MTDSMVELQKLNLVRQSYAVGKHRDRWKAVISAWREDGRGGRFSMEGPTREEALENTARYALWYLTTHLHALGPDHAKKAPNRS